MKLTMGLKRANFAKENNMENVIGYYIIAVDGDHNTYKHKEEIKALGLGFEYDRLFGAWHFEFTLDRENPENTIKKIVAKSKELKANGLEIVNFNVPRTSQAILDDND